MQHRKCFLCIFLILIFVLLSGCSKAAKSEREILEDLQSNPVFISGDVEISNYEIIKRQTDVDNRTDMVYITVQTDAPELTSSLTYELKYELYNDGWILESMQRYWDGPWEFSGLTDNQLLSDIKSNDFYFEDWFLAVQNFEIIDEVCDSNAIAYYEKRISADLTARGLQFDYYSSYIIYYRIIDGTWELESIDVLDRRYIPTSAPNENALDNVVENLELGSGASATSYDSYEYLKTETDWPNCTETRYYTATKNWWYGTETYLISIPLYFSLENGDDSSCWTYHSNEIVSSIYTVDWNLKGTWVNKYDSASFPYITVNLKINSFMETDDPEEYVVNLSCNASSSKYYYLCKTYGDVDAEITYHKPGSWFLYIDNTIAEMDSQHAWYAFDLTGYSAGATVEGFSWVYSTIGVSSSECKLQKET